MGRRQGSFLRHSPEAGLRFGDPARNDRRSITNRWSLKRTRDARLRLPVLRLHPPPTIMLDQIHPALGPPRTRHVTLRRFLRLPPPLLDRIDHRPSRLGLVP